jgi:predicted transcriptional regulator
MGALEKKHELKTRQKIYNYIQEHPGLHERELARQLEISLGTIDYHLYYLRKKELVITKSDGHYTQYYAAGKIGEKDKKLFAILRQKAPRKIIIFLLLNHYSYHRNICEHIGLAPSTTSFHLNKLVDLEIINKMQTGRETIFSIREPEYISDLLITHKKSFIDSAVSRFADTWLDLHPRHIHKKKKK